MKENCIRLKRIDDRLTRHTRRTMDTEDESKTMTNEGHTEMNEMNDLQSPCEYSFLLLKHVLSEGLFCAISWPSHFNCFSWRHSLDTLSSEHR